MSTAAKQQKLNQEPLRTGRESICVELFRLPKLRPANPSDPRMSQADHDTLKAHYNRELSEGQSDWAWFDDCNEVWAVLNKYGIHKGAGR